MNKTQQHLFASPGASGRILISLMVDEWTSLTTVSCFILATITPIGPQTSIFCLTQQNSDPTELSVSDGLSSSSRKLISPVLHSAQEIRSILDVLWFLEVRAGLAYPGALGVPEVPYNLGVHWGPDTQYSLCIQPHLCFLWKRQS